MKTILYTLFFSCLSLSLAGQTSLKIFPDPAYLVQCPGVEVNYYIFPWTTMCPAEVTLVGGQIIRQEINNGKLQMTVVWQESTDTVGGQVILHWTDSLCSGQTVQAWHFKIIPKVDTQPFITGIDSTFYIGEHNYLTLVATLPLPDNNVAEDFEWSVPPEWEFYNYGPNHSAAALIIPKDNILLEGCLRIRAKYPCGTWSNWQEVCLKGQLRGPCPIRISNDLLVCGDTTEHFIYGPGVSLPQLPQLPWSPTMYTWTVPPGWTILSDNPSTQSYILVKPSGNNAGMVSVVAKAGDFSSPACRLPVYFLSETPNTTIAGPEYVCASGDFYLTPEPSYNSTVTWQVRPLDPASPQLAVPDHGTGAAHFDINDPEGSGYFEITYYLSGPCGSNTHSKIFFIGKPDISNLSLDGAPYQAASLCVGYHGVRAEVEGMDKPLITWSSTGVQGYVQRDSFIFSLESAESNPCPVVTASAANICGTREVALELCPQSGCTRPEFDLLIYPNPAFLIVSLKTTSTAAVSGDYGMIERVEIFDQLGQLVTTWRESPTHLLTKGVGELPNGVYTLRATVWGQVIKKRLVIARL